MSTAELEGLEDTDGADDTVACDPEAETEGVYELVTVFLTKLSVAVWEEVVECVEVIVCVLEATGDLETVGEALCVLETEGEDETVDVLYILLVTRGDDDRLLRAVDVLDIKVDLVFVGELVSDFEAIELKEFVSVWTWDLDTLDEPEYEDVLEEEAVNVGVTVGMGIAVNFPEDVNVAVLHWEYLAVTEAVAEIVDDRVTLGDTEDVAVLVCVFETRIEPDTVAVWNLGVNVNLGE